MKKLNKTFKINPLYEADGYKIGHHKMLAKNTTRLAGTWIPRSTKYMPSGINKVMSAGHQFVIRYIHSVFQENFFDQPIEIAVDKFGKDMSDYTMLEYNSEHFKKLYNLGYLPIEIKALEEGIFTNKNIPHAMFINTIDGFAWLTLFLETLYSKVAWRISTVATIANKFKENAVKAVKETDEKNLWLTDFMCHDFHSRGGDPFTSIAAGLGHAFSNKGSDTLNVIDAARYYYDVEDDEMPIFSVNASEHSVSCTQLFYYEDLLKRGLLNNKIEEYYSYDLPCDGNVSNPDYLAIAEWLMIDDWLDRFPEGILSVVNDTMNTWKHITHILSRLKDKIINRDGKVVTRPDSGDPIDIICGRYQNKGAEKLANMGDISTFEKYQKVFDGQGEFKTEAEFKGVIELLWDIFGGTINEQGFKVLDPHIGAIYGDSINLERQEQIYKRLAAKRFASTNIIVGIGSYSLVLMTRDNCSWAAKGAWFEVEEYEDSMNNNTEQDCYKKSYNIYKDPITDDGTKKSLKGLQFVYLKDNEYVVEGEVSEEKFNSSDNLLRTIYRNGIFFNNIKLSEIREKIWKKHLE